MAFFQIRSTVIGTNVIALREKFDTLKDWTLRYYYKVTELL
jgi:hypothetical protein